MQENIREAIELFDNSNLHLYSSDLVAAYQTLKAAVLAQQTHNNARDETVRSCTNCGNEQCSMQAGVCSKWVQVKRTASPVA